MRIQNGFVLEVIDEFGRLLVPFVKRKAEIRKKGVLTCGIRNEFTSTDIYNQLLDTICVEVKYFFICLEPAEIGATAF